jgi:hypothetical protein
MTPAYNAFFATADTIHGRAGGVWAPLQQARTRHSLRQERGSFPLLVFETPRRSFGR